MVPHIVSYVVYVSVGLRLGTVSEKKLLCIQSEETQEKDSSGNCNRVNQVKIVLRSVQ